MSLPVSWPALALLSLCGVAMPISQDVQPNPDTPESVDEGLGHTGELAKPQGRAEVENRANRHHAMVDAAAVPHADGTSDLNTPENLTGPADSHLGAIETQVRQVPAPAGKAFTDEPKQG